MLGSPADELVSLGGDAQAIDSALAWLYDREEGDAAGAGAAAQGSGPAEGGDGLSSRNIRGRDGGRSSAGLSTVDWLESIGQLFPKNTIKRLEKDAIERYQLQDVVTDVEVLQRIEPNVSLLKAVLRTKNLMNPEVLAVARKVVEQVVRDLVEKLKTETQQAFSGTRARRPSRIHRQARNFDFERTIRSNLSRWNVEEQRLYIEEPQFFSRTRRHLDKWQVIMVVDQSGSMVSSVIHSAVTASILWALPGIKTHLVAFDTRVVDLTDDVIDPVELLMKVQLGGGTDIAGAVRYGAQLIDNPRRTIFVLITDFYEGGSRHDLVQQIGRLAEQGTHVLGLAALDDEANPVYNHELAQRCANAGAHIGAMTPGELAAFVAEKVG